MWNEASVWTAPLSETEESEVEEVIEAPVLTEEDLCKIQFFASRRAPRSKAEVSRDTAVRVPKNAATEQSLSHPCRAKDQKPAATLWTTSRSLSWDLHPVPVRLFLWRCHHTFCGAEGR